MTRRKISAAMLLFATSMLTVPTMVRADPVDLYFAASPYDCGGRLMLTEWRLRGETAGQVVLEVYQRRADRAGTQFEGGQWGLSAADLAAPLDLGGQNGRPEWRVSGLLTGQHAMTALDRKGEPRADCAPVFHPVQAAAARFAEVIALLDTPAPVAEQAAQVASALEGLPPAVMLPELEQVSTQQAIATKTEAFWKRYEENSLKRAADLSDETVFSGLDEMLVGTAEANRNTREWHSALLASAVEARSAARLAAGQSAQAEALDGAQFCTRIGSMATNNLTWSRYLEAATGVSLIGWDEALAQNYLNLAANCPAGKAFGDVVTRRWPEIQKLNQGKAALAAEAARLEGLELTLANAQAEGWFQLGYDKINHFRTQGLSDAEVRNRLEPILAGLSAKAAAPLAAELAEGVEAADFDAIPGYCETRRSGIDNGYRIATVLVEAQQACEIEATEIYKAAGLKLIAARKAELLAQEPTAEALMSGASFALPLLNQRFGNRYAGFAMVQDDLNVAISAANAELAPKVALARDAVKARIEQVVAGAGPLDPESKVGTACYEVQVMRVSGLEELAAYCNAEINKIARAQNVAQCDAIWQAIPGPKGFRDGTIAVPFETNPVPVGPLICGQDFQQTGITIEDNSGIIFSEYLLTNEKTVGGTQIRFTAILTEPANAGAPWTLTEPKLNDKPLSSPEMKTSADFLRCAVQLESCFRAN